MDTDGAVRTNPGGWHEGYAMNENGTVVGKSVNNYGDTMACTFDFVNSTTIELGVDKSEAHGINNNGQIVGWVNKDGKQQSFIYDSGSVSYFGPAFADNVYAYGINDNGQIVGLLSGVGTGNVFLYENGIMTDLGMAGYGYDINNNGQIVGTFIPETHAYLYDNGIMTDLGTLPGHTYSSAYAINDNGWIVGESSPGDGHSRNAVLWKPITEPEVIPLPSAVILGSLGLTFSGWLLHRRRMI